MAFHDPDELSQRYRNAYLRALDDECPEVFQQFQKLIVSNEKWLNRISNWETPVDRWINEIEHNDDPGFLFGCLTGDWSFVGYEAKPMGEVERGIIDGIRSFVEEFNSFLDRYCLKKDWIEHHLRWVAKLILSHGNSILGFSQFGLIEAFDLKIGESLMFTYPGMLPDRGDKRSYRKAAMKAFGFALDAHIEKTLKQFRSQYTQIRGPKHDFGKVKWLVYFNIRRMDKNAIRELMDSQFKDGRDNSTLDKIFQNLRNYDLPEREE